MSLNILLNGSKGRMGMAIIEAAKKMNANIVAALDVGDKPEEYIDKANIIIDFSFHSATPKIVSLASEKGIPVVIGTTGHTEEERREILNKTNEIPIVWAGNYSIGVNLLFYLSKKAAEILDSSYDPEIIEMHHRHKADAPSGTAERLIEVIREARKIAPEFVKHGRYGISGERPVNEIGVHALRGGEVIGDHTVIFAGANERFELSHKAANRSIFAEGAIHAANWVVDKSPGLYKMEDVLGFKD